MCVGTRPLSLDIPSEHGGKSLDCGGFGIAHCCLSPWTLGCLPSLSLLQSDAGRWSGGIAAEEVTEGLWVLIRSSSSVNRRPRGAFCCCASAGAATGPATERARGASGVGAGKAAGAAVRAGSMAMRVSGVG